MLAEDVVKRLGEVAGTELPDNLRITLRHGYGETHTVQKGCIRIGMVSCRVDTVEQTCSVLTVSRQGIWPKDVEGKTGQAPLSIAEPRAIVAAVAEETVSGSCLCHDVVRGRIEGDHH